MTFFTNQKYAQTGLVILNGAFSIGASGAPTLITTGGASNGILAVTRVSTGVYNIVLGSTQGLDKYKFCLWAEFTLELASALPTVYPQPDWTGYSVSTSTLQVTYRKPTASSGPTLSSTAADPDNGSIIYFELHLKMY